MTGCSNCTYCIVPYVRGHERSRTAEAVIGGCERLVADGVREIILGQNVNFRMAATFTVKPRLQSFCVRLVRRVLSAFVLPPQIKDLTDETYSYENSSCLYGRVLERGFSPSCSYLGLALC